MAILEELGLEVKIIVDGSPLREYEDKEQNPANDGFGDEIPKCRRYVEVTGETEFGVQLDATSNEKYFCPTKALKFAIDLDGKDEIQNRVLKSQHLTSLVEGKEEHDGQEFTLRRFRFTNVSTGRSLWKALV